VRVGITGIGGGVGVSTLATLLLATWPGEQVIGIEANSDGGVWAARCGLSGHQDAPGLTSLLADIRNLGERGTAHHAQQLWDNSVSVFCAPTAPRSAAKVVSVLAQSWDDVVSLLPDSDVIVDCGHWRAGSSGAKLLAGCDVGIVVTRASIEYLEMLAGDADALLVGGPVGVVFRGESAHRPEEVTRFVARSAEAVDKPGDLPIVGTMAEDAAAVRLLYSGGASRSLRKSNLIRSVQPIANALSARAELLRPLTVEQIVGVAE
jgi:MinD-like ATPase involved in chromosome partitioning or flagellar assembly